MVRKAEPHKMHICFVSREYPTEDHTGGIATYTEKTALAVARLGQKVTVITESWGKTSTQTENGVTVIRLGTPQTPPRLLLRGRMVARAIKSLPVTPDIVQVCEYRAEGFWRALRSHGASKLVTRLATPTFLVERLNSHEQDATMRTRIVNQLERYQTRHSDAIISPTDALADIVCEEWDIPRERVTTIRTGVEFAGRFAALAADLPEELRGREYLLYFGRLEERKGVHILAEALPTVLASHPELHAVFVGNVQSFHGQSLRAFIEERNAGFSERLHFFPRLAQRQLYPILAHALFAVLPSLWENLANTCLEALDMGKPVVATLGCGFSEVIEEGRSGMLVPPGDAPALAQALLSMLADRDRLSRMSVAAKERSNIFSQDAAARELLHLYERLCSPTVGHQQSSRIISGHQ